MVCNFILLICFLIFSTLGCTLLPYYQQLLTLREVSNSQREIHSYIDKQEELFYKLRDDVKNNRLKTGMMLVDIIDTYGEPVISKEVDDVPSIKEVLLYRHPTQFFSSDRIYLYFDDVKKLSYWKHEFPQ